MAVKAGLGVGGNIIVLAVIAGVAYVFFKRKG